MAHQAPLPANDGGRQRSLALLRCLAARFGVTVAVLHGAMPSDPAPALAEAERERQLAGVTWLDLTGGRLAQLTALPQLLTERRPPVMRHFSQLRQRHILRELLSSGRFCAVIADTPYATGSLPPHRPPSEFRDTRPSARKPAPSIPLIVNTHNVEREVWQAAAADVSGSRLTLMLDRHLVTDWELRALDQADAVAFCSQRDADVLTPDLRPGLAASVVPNAVDTEHIQPLGPPREATSALFVGSLRYAPNAQAARFVVERLAPLLARHGITVVIAGGDGVDAPGVRFAGRPADLDPLYAQAFAAVIPLFSGSGTRLKVLEALAYGRPLVASAKAVEGLGLTPEEHYLLAQTETEFESQLARLAADLEVGSRLATRGRAFVEAHHTWISSGASLLALLAECGVPVPSVSSPESP